MQSEGNSEHFSAAIAVLNPLKD